MSRYFEVKVTGCNDDCKNLRNKGESRWAFCALSQRDDKRTTYNENFYGITPSCPMYPQSQEVEK